MKPFTKENKIFIILGILIVFVLYYNFIYRKQLKDIDTLKKNIEEYKDISKVNEEVKLRVEGMDSEVKILNEKLNAIRRVFPPKINHDEVLIMIRDITKKSGLTIDAMTFSEIEEVVFEEALEGKEGEYKVNTGLLINPSLIEIKDYRVKAAMDILGINMGNTKSQSSEGEQSVNDGKSYKLKISINAKGTNSQMKRFMKSIEGLNNKVSFDSVIISNGKGGQLSASMILGFYGIMDKKAADKQRYLDLTWEPSGSAYKDNIFKPYEGYKGPLNDGTNGGSKTGGKEQNVDTVASEINTYDFTMRVMPYGENMSPPTVTLVGKSIKIDKNEFKIPIVYGDNRGSEKVEIYIEHKDGKYLCRLKTDHDLFPGDKTSDLAEFIPLGYEIKLLIDSSQRISTKDNSGTTVTLINKTQRKLVVDVVNDDIVRPRVTIKKSSENILVNYR